MAYSIITTQFLKSHVQRDHSKSVEWRERVGTRPSLYTCRNTYILNRTRRSRFPSLDSSKAPSETSPASGNANASLSPRQEP